MPAHTTPAQSAAPVPSRLSPNHVSLSAARVRGAGCLQHTRARASRRAVPSVAEVKRLSRACSHSLAVRPATGTGAPYFLDGARDVAAAHTRPTRRWIESQEIVRIAREHDIGRRACRQDHGSVDRVMRPRDAAQLAGRARGVLIEAVQHRRQSSCLRCLQAASGMLSASVTITAAPRRRARIGFSSSPQSSRITVQGN